MRGAGAQRYLKQGLDSAARCPPEKCETAAACGGAIPHTLQANPHDETACLSPRPPPVPAESQTTRQRDLFAATCHLAVKYGNWGAQCQLPAIICPDVDSIGISIIHGNRTTPASDRPYTRDWLPPGPAKHPGKEPLRSSAPPAGSCTPRQMRSLAVASSSRRMPAAGWPPA